MKTIIKEITNITSEGVSYNLTEKASLTGEFESASWFVSWDKVGAALFGDQYTDATSVKELNTTRKKEGE